MTAPIVLGANLLGPNLLGPNLIGPSAPHHEAPARSRFLTPLPRRQASGGAGTWRYGFATGRPSATGRSGC